MKIHCFCGDQTDVSATKRTTRFDPAHGYFSIKINNSRVDPTDASATTVHCPHNQWTAVCLNLNIGYVTPTIINFLYLDSFLDQNIQKSMHLILITKALVHTFLSKIEQITADDIPLWYKRILLVGFWNLTHCLRWSKLDLSLNLCWVVSVLILSASVFKFTWYIFWILWSRKYFSRSRKNILSGWPDRYIGGKRSAADSSPIHACAIDE